jgi:hypothetical protein
MRTRHSPGSARRMTLPQSPPTLTIKKIPSAAEQLQRVLRQGGHDHGARLIFSLLHGSRAVFERVAWYVSEYAIHASGNRLLNVMVGDAFRAAERMHKQFPVPGYGEQLVSIYTELLRSLPDLNMVKAENLRGEIWDPLYGQPLSEWLGRQEQVQVGLLDEPNDILGHMTPVSFRTAISSFLLTERDMVELGEEYPRVMGVGYR